MRTIESSPLPTADDMIELETHANWRADDIGDVEEWTLRLTAAHHAELDTALAHARSVTDDILGQEGVKPLDFPHREIMAAGVPGRGE